jgi:hypothetical protein
MNVFGKIGKNADLNESIVVGEKKSPVMIVLDRLKASDNVKE